MPVAESIISSMHIDRGENERRENANKAGEEKRRESKRETIV